MRSLIAFALACAVAAAHPGNDIEPERPVWPDEYQISWNFTVPYIDEIQKSQGGFKYTYQAWQDTHLGRQKVVRDGVETVITLVPVNRQYEVFPAYDHLLCWQDDIHGGTGPTAPAARTGSTQQQAEQPQLFEEGGRPQGGAKAGTEGGGAEWGTAAIDRGLPLSQQRRRLQAGGRLRQEAGADGQRQDQGQPAAEAGRYMFDWEKKPAKLLGFLLPDLSEERWVYAGTEVFKETGQTARVYQWQLTAGGASEMQYRFYVTRDGVPLRLWMMGTNLYTGGHKDEYVATYHSYKPGPHGDAAFQLPHGLSPDDCKPAAPDAQAQVQAAAVAAPAAASQAGGAAAAAGAAAGVTGAAPHPGALRASFARHMPSVHWGHADYDAFVHRHGRRHRGRNEYHARHAIFEQSRTFVDSWNERRAAHLAAAASAALAHSLAANVSAALEEGSQGVGGAALSPVPHEVALNQFADWTREEYLALVRPQRLSKRLLAAQQPGVRVHRVTTPSHMVPAQVIWRGTPADSPVKDQAACGSCWSFSTVGALEAAWYRTTASQLLFSEQQLVDCGWEGGNSGCYGGDQIRALNWVLQRGGLASNAEYPYQGVNNYCRTDVAQKKFKGSWVLVEGGEEALKEAVLTKGPMIVSIDASDDSFRFYSGGLYSRPQCATQPADLDHAVIISGYGTSDDGQDYWLVKNMWSSYWGEGGYMRVARHPNDCGVASEPVYVDLKA